ncbi:MAG: circadian clock KaiB family protein [Acidobacteriia bacterium]|nr:circadian clock KaiB family protein [Terriglobia bacterium]
MRRPSTTAFAAKLERAGSQAFHPKYVLRLYVSGSTAKSARAVENIKRICEERLPNRYELEVIDIYQQPQLARGEQIVVAPTLIKRLPPPLRRLIGDMSDQEQVLMGLALKKRE